MSRWFGCQFYVLLTAIKTMLQREPGYSMASVELISSKKKDTGIFIIIHTRHKIKLVHAVTDLVVNYELHKE